MGEKLRLRIKVMGRVKDGGRVNGGEGLRVEGMVKGRERVKGGGRVKD